MGQQFPLDAPAFRPAQASNNQDPAVINWTARLMSATSKVAGHRPSSLVDKAPTGSTRARHSSLSRPPRGPRGLSQVQRGKPQGAPFPRADPALGPGLPSSASPASTGGRRHAAPVRPPRRACGSPGEGDALAAFLASAHIGATVGGNATGFSPAIARGRSIVGGSPGRRRRGPGRRAGRRARRSPRLGWPPRRHHVYGRCRQQDHQLRGQRGTRQGQGPASARCPRLDGRPGSCTVAPGVPREAAARDGPGRCGHRHARSGRAAYRPARTRQTATPPPRRQCGRSPQELLGCDLQFSACLARAMVNWPAGLLSWPRLLAFSVRIRAGRQPRADLGTSGYAVVMAPLVGASLRYGANMPPVGRGQ